MSMRVAQQLGRSPCCSGSRPSIRSPAFHRSILRTQGFKLFHHDHQGQSHCNIKAKATSAITVLCEDDTRCITDDDGSIVRDDLDALLEALPEDLRDPIRTHPRRAQLLEVVMDLGRPPEARFQGSPGGEYLRQGEVTAEDLRSAEQAVGVFGADNRAGIAGTLHRISAIRNRKGHIIGLTCRVGRAVEGHIDMIRDLVESSHSVLMLGRPGVGKTTVIREVARVLSVELKKRVVIIDTSNEIGGDGDVPHPAIGNARRMQVPNADKQHLVMIEAVENHMPEVVIVDEIGTEAEAMACRTIAERGVTLIGTAHGRLLENLIKNPTLCDLVGGVESVTLGDEEARNRRSQKTVLERKGPPTFPIVVEIRERGFYVAHWAQDSVDAILQSKVPMVQVRERDPVRLDVRVQEVKYDKVTDPAASTVKGRSPYDADYDEALQQARAAEAATTSSTATSKASNSTGVSTQLVLNNAVPWTLPSAGCSMGSAGTISAGEVVESDVASVSSECSAQRHTSMRGMGFGMPRVSSSSFVKSAVMLDSKQNKRSKGKTSARKGR